MKDKIVLQNVTIEDIPNPKGGLMTIKYDDVEYQFVITNQILLKGGDIVELNVYGEFVQMLGRVNYMGIAHKYESRVIRHTDMDSIWHSELKIAFDTLRNLVDKQKA